MTNAPKVDVQQTIPNRYDNLFTPRKRLLEGKRVLHLWPQEVLLSVYIWGFVFFDSFIRLLSRLYLWVLPNSMISLWRDIVFICILGYAVLRNLYHRLPIKPNAIDIVAILWFINGLVGSLLTQDVTLTLRALRITYIPVLIYLLIRTLPMSKDLLRHVLAVFLSMSCVVALLGIYMSFIMPRSTFFALADLVFPLEVNAAAVLYRVGLTRMTSILFSPTPFGVLMAGAATCAFALAITTRQRKYIYMILLFSFCNLFSFTRGAWLFQIFGFFAVMLVIMRRVRRRFWRMVTIVLLGLVAVAILTQIFLSTYRPGGISDLPTLVSLFSDPEELYNRGLQHRVEMYTQIWNDLMDFPFGHGVGMVGRVAAINNNNVSLGTPSISDGWYFKVIAETGFLGILTFGSFLLVTLNRLYRLARRARSDNLEWGYHAALLGMFVGMSALALVSNAWDIEPMAPIMWVFLALGASIRTRSLLQRPVSAPLNF